MYCRQTCWGEQPLNGILVASFLRTIAPIIVVVRNKEEPSIPRVEVIYSPKILSLDLDDTKYFVRRLAQLVNFATV